MARLVKNLEDDSLEASPLLSSSRIGSMTSETSKSRYSSTINPDKFDMSRFTSRVEEEEGSESSVRIILYVIAVIVVGVGLALFVKFFITKDSNEPVETTENTEQTPQTSELDPVNISIAPRADSQATATTAEFSEAVQTSIGNAGTSATATNIKMFNYDRFTTFAQLKFEFEGLTAEALPQLNISLNKSLDELLVKLPTETTVAEAIKSDIVINDIISNVKFDSTTSAFTIKFREDSQYRVFTNGNTIIIDVKTVEQITSEDSSSTPQEETPSEDSTNTQAPPTPPVDTKPTTKNFDNEFSKEKQFIVSNVKTNSISYNEIYYTDNFTNFELAFGMRNSVGDNFVPNASAEIIKENSVNFIELRIENLSSLEFSSNNIIDSADISIDMSAANFVKAELKSFDETSGLAVIRIQLKNEADFRLVSEPTVSGLTQVLAIQIKD